MKIYLSDNLCNIDPIKTINNIIDKSIQINSPDIRRNASIIKSKNTLLIDVFDTFIEPAKTDFDVWFIKQEGAAEFVLARDFRKGFMEFKTFYSSIGGNVAVHSDALYNRDFDTIRKEWEQKYVESKFVKYYFGKEYSKEFKGIRIKDFQKMCDIIGCNPRDSMIISDGGNDILSAIYSNIDILLVPRFSTNKEFDYRILI